MTTELRHFDYDLAARTYDAHRRGRGPYFPALQEISTRCPVGLALEVGAGTGNNTAEFVACAQRRVVAMEPSRGMLAQGAAKVPGAAWLRGRIEALPFADAGFAMVYGTYMLHHVRDLGAAFAECFRCIDSGAAAFVTVSHEFIDTHPMNAYFPSFAAIDKARFHPIERLLDALEEVGFTEVGAQFTLDEPKAINEAYAAKIAGKFISTYALLPEDEFDAGVARLREDIAAHGGALPEAMVREAVVVYGWKP